MNNKLAIFNHEKFGEVRTVYNEKEDEVWFVARDLSKQLGYKSIERMYDHVDKEDKQEINPQSQSYRGLGLEPKTYVYRMILINKRGALSAIQSSDALINKKRELIKLLRLENYIILQSRAEIEFGEQLILFMNQLGCSLETQYKILNYYIDFYIPELNIAIEYDEERHKYSYDEDRQRELEIQKEIGCKFVRIEDGLNIGTQLGQIVKHIKEEI